MQASAAVKPTLEAAEADSHFETSHPRVQYFLDDDQNDLYAYVSRSLIRGRQYLPQISSILEEEGLPRELAYLPIIESGFKLNAVSPAGAVGPWQFMRATGRRYGLRIDQYVDERRDPEKATRAAARYLRDLYDMFEDWHLSLAAYNRGEGAIAQLRLHTDDYWEMSARGYLPRETRNYVPRFLATLEIARAAEEEGIEGTELAPSEPSKYDSLTLDRSITLRAVAELSGRSLDEISELNPAVCRGVVPAGYVVRVPMGSRHSVEAGYASAQRAAALTYEPRGVTHRVRRGETMGSIARRYGVSVKALMNANRLRSAKTLQAGKILRIPVKRKPAYRSYASNLRSARTRQVN